MQGLRKVNEIGSGESLCQTPKEWRLGLNNVEIDLPSALEITGVLLHCFGAQPIRIEFCKEGKTQWGTAFVDERRVRINRHSVCVLLHEVSHILTWDKDKRARTHGYTFARVLDTCYSIYFTYLKAKQRKEN